MLLLNAARMLQEGEQEGGIERTESAQSRFLSAQSAGWSLINCTTHRPGGQAA